MRSVFAFPALSPEEAETILNASGERRELTADLGPEWVVDGCLYARIERDGDALWADWSDKEVDRLCRQLGQVPTWGLVIDVSGRIDGLQEVTRLLRPLLASGGVALDDYSERPWTLTEIENGATDETRRFLHPG